MFSNYNETLMARSIGAIVIGFLYIGVLSIGADSLLERVAPGAFDDAGRVHSVPLLLFTQLYVAVFAISGCYLTALLAPSHPMRHALIVGAVGLAFSIVATITLWDMVPVWYHVLTLALVMPFAWIGGRIRENQLAPRTLATS